MKLCSSCVWQEGPLVTSITWTDKTLITATEIMISNTRWKAKKRILSKDIIQAAPWLSSPLSLPGSVPSLAYGTVPWAPHRSTLKVSALGPYCIDFLWVVEKPLCFSLLFSLNDAFLHGRLSETPSNIQSVSFSSTYSRSSGMTMN